MIDDRTMGRTERTRRRMLQAVGASGVVGLAGCLTIGGQNETIDPVENHVSVDPDEIVTGGTLRAGIITGPDTFDQPESVEATSSVIHTLFWEGLVRTGRDGTLYPWLSKSYELREVQNVDSEDYEPYMRTAPVVHPDDGMPYVDVDEQIVVRHPETDLATNDQARVLTVAETGDAVAAGVFGMQFRHELHEGITFHDGEALTAENVVRSYERWEGSANAGQVFNQFLHAEAVDDYTVDIYAQFPDAEAVDDILWPVYPTAMIETPPGEMDPREGNPPIGTGPWVFEEYEEDSFLAVSRNDNYWVDDLGLEAFEWWDGPDGFPSRPVIDRIELEISSQAATRAGALERGEIDLTYNLTADQRTSFNASDGFRVSTTASGSYLFVQYPVTVEPFDDQRVRRAINHLIPRTDIVESVAQGWAEEAWAPLPRIAAETGTTDYEQLQSDLRPYNEYDPERAVELLEEAGVDTPIEVPIQTNAESEDRIRTGEVIVESLNQLEQFEARLETPGDLTTFVSMIFGPSYHEEGNVVLLTLDGTFNPHSFVETLHHPNQFNQCCNATIPPGSLPDDFITQMNAAQFGMDVAEDPDLRRERYDDLWERFVELSANSIATFDFQTATLTDDVRGYNAYPFGGGFLSHSLWSPEDEQITYLDRN